MNSCCLPEDRCTKRITSPPLPDVSSYLALLHAEIARFTSPCRDIVTVALILPRGLLREAAEGPGLAGCIILWSSDFPPRPLVPRQTPSPVLV